MVSEREESHDKSSPIIPDLCLGTGRWSHSSGLTELTRMIIKIEADGVARILEQAPRGKRTGNCLVKELQKSA